MTLGVQWPRRLASCILGAVALCALFAPAVAPHRYDEQFRDALDAGPSARFPMGSDSIGRDRLSRLVYATRISAILAPAAAFVSIAIALALAGFSPIAKRAFGGFTTICLSLPWIFLFIILRAELPLDTGPGVSVLLTFALMGAAGWAWPGRVFAACIEEIRHSGWLIQARASGLSGWRIARVYVWPHLRDIALAQFRVLVPAYILSEASLGLLGLGVSEPMPSWGNLLQDLQHPDLVQNNPWVLAPLGLLIVVMISLEILGSQEPAL